MISIVGNQVYNPPTMKSFGGVYASEAYARFDSPNFNTPQVFHSARGEGAEWMFKKVGGSLKYTDEATELFVKGLDVNDMRVFAKELGLESIGGGPLADTGQEALVTAIRGRLKNSGNAKINSTLSNLLTSGTDESIETATKILRNLEDAGVVEAVLDPSVIRQFGSHGGTAISRELAQEGTEELGESIIAGSGGRTLDDVLGGGADGVSLTDDQFNTLVRGTTENPGFLRQIRTSASNAPTRWTAGLVLGIAAIPTVGPLIVGGLIGRIFDGVGETLCIATDAGCGDDSGSGSDGGGLSVPECPSADIGTECDASTTLQLGCICAAGVVEQQGFKLNYKGYLALGGIALLGVGLFAMILR